MQTRSLFDWMVSRVNQGSYNYLIGLKSKEIDDEVMYRWIEDRNYWYNKVHEIIKGHKKFSALPTNPEYSLWHPKEITRQEAQNKYYDTL